MILDGLANSGVVLDHNTHDGITTCSSCDPAMVHLAYGSSTPSGVTISNTLFANGNADGIQTGVGVNIIGNEFRNIRENGPNDTAHTDAIQLLGAAGSVVRGNYIHNTADGIVAYDRISNALIENNVIDLVNGRWGIELYSDSGSIVRHNTLVYNTGCAYAPCGLIVLDHKSTDPAGKGTIVQDNIATEVWLNNGSTVAKRDHNMVRRNAGSRRLHRHAGLRRRRGSHDVGGLPPDGDQPRRQERHRRRRARHPLDAARHHPDHHGARAFSARAPCSRLVAAPTPCISLSQPLFLERSASPDGSGAPGRQGRSSAEPHPPGGQAPRPAVDAGLRNGPATRSE